MMKKYSVGFEFIVKNDRFENGKKTFIRDVDVYAKSFEKAVKLSYDRVLDYLDTNYDNYDLISYGVEVY